MEFDDDEAACRAHDPPQLGREAREILDVVEDVIHEDKVERAGAERKPCAVKEDTAHPRVVGNFVEDLLVDLGHDDDCRSVDELDGPPAVAAAVVEDRRARRKPVESRENNVAQGPVACGDVPRSRPTG